MELKRIISSQLEENTYIIINKENALVIDPGCEKNKIITELGSLSLKGVLVTHYHPDHIISLNELISTYNVPVYDYRTLGRHRFDGFHFRVIENKGHTKDSVSFLFEDEKVLFTGDFIFRHDIGYTHFKGGDMNEMNESLKNFKSYDPHIKIFPGHGEFTDVLEELNNNPYLKG